jgi:hypothetical protein
MVFDRYDVDLYYSVKKFFKRHLVAQLLFLAGTEME